MRNSLLILCVLQVLYLNAQTQVGGFIYAWDNYDNSMENGLGTASIAFDSIGMRPIQHAPEIGVHPRIFFGPSEIPDIQNRLETLASGQAAANQIHAFTTLLHLGASNYNHNANYGLDNDGNRWINNSGFWSSHDQYYKLIAEDPTVWDGEEIKRKHITSCMMALEAFECLMNPGETDADTGLDYNDRAQDLAKAMAFWASLVIGDPDTNPNSNNFNHFGGTHMALAYDLNYNAMTDAQRDLVRQALVQITPDEPRHGAWMPAYANTSNWTTLNSFEIICNLAIEGEPGYKPELTERWMRTFHNFITYGWYPSGAGYEGLGKNYQFVTTMIACAKRGYSLLSHPHVKAYATEFLPAIQQPFGHAFTSYDVWGGSGNDAETGGYKFSPADVVGLKWIFPDDPKVDFVWRNYIERSSSLDSEGYVYQQIRPDDSYYNYLIPAAIFAQDYNLSSWQEQADANISSDYFADDRGLMVMKSGTEASALATQFHVRQDMGGHTHGDRNDFTLSALERIWIRKSYGGSQFQPTWFHSCILIDDVGMGVGDPDGDKCRQPGKVLHWESDDKMSVGVGDATYAYSWEWHWSPQSESADHPWLGNDGWTKVTETWNDFRYNPGSADYFNTPFYEFPHWHQADKFERMVKRPYNPMQQVTRSVALVKGPKPFLLVVDDVQKDENIHEYKWLAQIARDLTIESTEVNLDLENYKNDIVLSEPESTGNRKLLVRILNNEGFDGTLEPGYIDTLEYFDFFSGNPYNSNPNLIRPRLIIESNSVRPDFKVMLFPFEAGQSLPITHWNTTKDTLTVIFNGEEQQIAFQQNTDLRTLISLVDETVSSDELPDSFMISLFPNPSSDYVYLNGLEVNDEVTIFSSDGKQINSYRNPEAKLKLNISTLAKGNYYVEIKRAGLLKSLQFTKL